MKTTYKFGFDKCQSFTEIKERKKRLALLLHPDKGGDATLFASMSEEAQQRVDELSKINFQNNDVDFIANLLRTKIEPQTLSIIANILKSI